MLEGILLLRIRLVLRKGNGDPRRLEKARILMLLQLRTSGWFYQQKRGRKSQNTLTKRNSTTVLINKQHINGKFLMFLGSTVTLTGWSWLKLKEVANLSTICNKSLKTGKKSKKVTLILITSKTHCELTSFRIQSDYLVDYPLRYVKSLVHQSYQRASIPPPTPTSPRYIPGI